MSSKWTEQRHPRPARPGGRRDRRQHRPGLRDRPDARRARAAVVLAVRDVEKGKQAAARIDRRRHRAGPGPDLAGLVRAAAADLRATHPRIDLLINNAGVMYTPKQTTARRLRAAVRHQPPRPLRAHRAAAGPAAAGARLPRGDGQQHRPPHPGRDPLRRPAVGALVQPGRRLRPVQAGQPDVHLRAAAPARTARHHRRGGRAPRRVQHRARPQHPRRAPGARSPGSRRCSPRTPAMGALPTLRAATDPGRPRRPVLRPRRTGEIRGYPRLVTSSPESQDQAIQQRLWAVSEELTGVTYPVESVARVG